MRNGEVGRELVAEREVRLAVALRDFDAIIAVIDLEHLVRDVFHHPGATAALKVGAELGRKAGPDFDAGPVLGVVHGNVVHVDILDDVDFFLVLAEAAD